MPGTHGPTGNRSTTNARAEQAWNLRCTGRTWPEIARELHYGSANSARKAVTKWLQRNPNDDLETMRRASGAMLVNTTRKLDKALDAALEKGATRDAAELGKAIFDGIEKHAKLTGQHVVVPKQVDVKVTQTLTQILADTRDRLLAGIESGSVIDGEVIDVQETRQVES